MNKPKILFVYDMNPKHVWMDGLWAALNLLEEDFEINQENLAISLPERFPVDGVGFDFVLGWGAFNSRVDRQLQDYVHKYKDTPSGLCIGGNAMSPNGADKYDVLFYETKWYRNQIKHHTNIVHAFGVNTDIFCKPEGMTPVVWDYIGVGALADWKRWERMKDKKGNRLVIGYYQDGNKEESGRIAQDLLLDGVMVGNQINPFDLANLYHWSRTAYIPADIFGGGERSVLEARACGLPVEIEGDNPKLQELLESPIYDQHYYYQQLKKGILSVL